jgi:hypothetical protein
LALQRGIKIFRRGLLHSALSVTLLLSVSGCGISNSANSTYSPDSFESAEPEPTPTVDPRWAPKGFTQLDESIAYKYTTNKGSWPCQDCNFLKITVIANVNCSSGVYAEVNFLDSGTVMDWSNDSIPYLGAGQKAVLTFEHYPYESNIDSGELTKLTCY